MYNYHLKKHNTLKPSKRGFLLNIDLHIHTTASDGTLSPSQIVQEAAEAGLKVIAIADHDTTDGLAEALEAQKQFDITVVPGVEISADDPMGEVHILGYWMNYEDPLFQDFLLKPRAARPDRIIEMCNKLTDIGLSVQPEEVFEKAGGRDSVGRPHLARILLEKGYIKNMDEAFDRYLTEGCPAYVKRFKNTVDETLAKIHKAGGISVIAHPGLIKNPDILPSLIEKGAMGMEVLCHDHDQEASKKYAAMAERHGLLKTGGSDYHGEMLEKSFRLGDLKVPYELYLGLKKAKETGRSG